MLIITIIHNCISANYNVWSACNLKHKTLYLKFSDGEKIKQNTFSNKPEKTNLLNSFQTKKLTSLSSMESWLALLVFNTRENLRKSLKMFSI